MTATRTTTGPFTTSRASYTMGAGGAVVLAVLVFFLGRALAPTPAPANPIANAGGIPLGTEHSPAGALAAADSYLAVEQKSVEGDPPLETRLIETDDAPWYRTADLQSAEAARAADPTGMWFWAHAGHAVWVLGARRLDAYSGRVAKVTAWDGTVYWGGGRAAPGQSWGLDHVSLSWVNRRWLVTEDVKTLSGGPVPASTPQASSENRTTPTFEQELTGYTSPQYGGAPR